MHIYTLIRNCWKRAGLAATMIMLIVVGCAAPTTSLTRQPENADLLFSSDDLVRLEAAANNGSDEAAFKLAMYYQQIVKDSDKRLVWLQKASSLGSTAALEYLVTTYMRDPERANAEQAADYLKKLEAKYGETDAKNRRRITDLNEELAAMKKTAK
jgi:hypothetical protein